MSCAFGKVGGGSEGGDSGGGFEARDGTGDGGGGVREMAMEAASVAARMEIVVEEAMKVMVQVAVVLWWKWR